MTAPAPHPASQQRILEWEAGWGCGPVPYPRERITL